MTRSRIRPLARAAVLALAAGVAAAGCAAAPETVHVRPVPRHPAETVARPAAPAAPADDAAAAGHRDRGASGPVAPAAGTPAPGPREAAVPGAPTTGGPQCDEAAPAPDMDPFAMRLPPAGTAGLSEERGRYTDLFLASPSGRVSVGVRKDWGGAVVFFGHAGNARSNVLDAHDTGRALQIALYDRARHFQGCAWDASCVEHPSPCEKSITFLGWDPVQGGDECGRGSRLLSARLVGDALEIEAQPLQWNPEWEARGCSTMPCRQTTPQPVGVRYRATLRFVREDVVEVAWEVVNDEQVDHPPSLQEFPTLYVSAGGQGPDLERLLDSDGTPVDAGQQGGQGMLTGDFHSPEPWVSWQNAAGDYGVGLAMDQGTREFIVWRDAGERSGRFRNVRARLVFPLRAGGRVRGVSYLALGGRESVRGALAEVLRTRAPFGAVEEPPAGATASAAGRPVTLQGWALDTAAVDHVAVFVDGVEKARAPVDRRRPDICAQYPRYGACPFAGFSAALPAELFDAPCPRLLRVVAADADGNEQVLGERLVGR